MIKKVILLTLLAYNVNTFSAAFEEGTVFAGKYKFTPCGDKQIWSAEYSIKTSPTTLKSVVVSADYRVENPCWRIVTVSDTSNVFGIIPHKMSNAFGSISDDLCKRLFRGISEDFLDNHLQFLFFSVKDVEKGSLAYDQLERVGFRPYICNPTESQYPIQFIDKEAELSSFATLGVHREDAKLKIEI